MTRSGEGAEHFSSAEWQRYDAAREQVQMIVLKGGYEMSRELRSAQRELRLARGALGGYENTARARLAQLTALDGEVATGGSPA